MPPRLPPSPLAQDFVRRFVEGRAGLQPRRRTLLMVAHRPTGLEACEQVVMIDSHRVVEAGPPAALLARPGGHFAALQQHAGGGEGGGSNGGSKDEPT